MENEFTNQMKKKLTNELTEIIKNKEDWQPAAVEAAEAEIKKRKELIGSNDITAENEDNFEFDTLEKIKNSSDSELLGLYKNSFSEYSKIELDYLSAELTKRKIEPKVWYYSKGNNKNGPYSNLEMKEFAEKKEIDFYDYVWRDGLENWIEAKNVVGLFNKNVSIPPRIGNQKPDWISTTKEEKPVSIIIAAIILFIKIPIWFYIIFFMAGVSVLINNSGLALITILTLIIPASLLTIGIGIIKLKKWAYKWGLYFSIFSFLQWAWEYLNTGLVFFIFLSLIELVVIILLYTNRYSFDTTVTKTEEIYI